MNDYLTKPLHLRDLESVLQRALRHIHPASTTSIMPAPQTDPDILDRTIIDGLKELREPGQPDPLRELINLFLRDSLPRLEKMRTTASSGDLHTLGAAAHTFKGSASNLGARHLATLCASLEKQAQAGDSATAIATLREIESEFTKVQDVLHAEVERPASS